MSTSRDAASSIALTRVKPGREQEFEAFVRDVIAPAVERARPHLTDLWQVLRPSEDESRDGGVYAFVFYGDVPEEDWELDRLFAEVHGADEAVRLGAPVRRRRRWGAGRVCLLRRGVRRLTR